MNTNKGNIIKNKKVTISVREMDRDLWRRFSCIAKMRDQKICDLLKEILEDFNKKNLFGNL